MNRVDRAEELFRSELYDRAFEVEGAMDILKYLCGKYRVFAASNAIEKQQIYRLKKANMYDLFEKVFISEGIGHDKPSKGFFDYCFAVAGGFAPNEAVMIGDSITADIKGAYEMGIKTIWYNHDRKEKPEEKIYDFYVENLTEIKDII
jgi:HAD superfamily hydrolase (TIGR01549 family)